MPANTTTALVADTWLQANVAAVAAIRVVNLGSEPIWLQGSATTTPPAAGDAGVAGAIPLLPGQVLATDITLAQLFPGVISSTGYLFIRSPSAAKVSLSYA